MEHLHCFLLDFFLLQKHATTAFPVSLLAMLDGPESTRNSPQKSISAISDQPLGLFFASQLHPLKATPHANMRA